MRALLLLLLLLAPPFAAAQAEPLAPTLSIEPFGASVQPLKGAIVTNYTLTMSCVSGEPPKPARATVRVASAPAWAQVVASPVSLAAPQDCVATTTLRGTLTVTASADAPARRAEPITLVAGVVDAAGNRSASATANVTTAYFGILDAQLQQAVATVRPGGVASFTVRLVNAGNGATRVSFAAESASGGLTLAPLDDITLGSKQQGDANVSADVLVRVASASGGAGYVNRVGTVTMRVSAVEAATGAPGDATRESFVVTTRGLSVPWGLPAPLAALALGAMISRKRR